MQIVIAWGIFRKAPIKTTGVRFDSDADAPSRSEHFRIAPDDASFLTENPFHLMDAMMSGALRDMADMHEAMRLDDGWDRLELSPTMDMRSSSGGYLISLNIPGVDSTNVNVAIDGRVLSISASGAGSSGYGRRYNRFERRVLLPGAIGLASDMRATMTNGLLRIFVPKGDRLSQPRMRIRVY